MYTLIIGKTIEESPSYITMPRTSVPTGVQDLTSTITRKDVGKSIIVLIAMVGRSRSIILKITNLICVSMGTSAQNRIVLTIIQTKIEDLISKFGLKFFQKLE